MSRFSNRLIIILTCLPILLLAQSANPAGLQQMRNAASQGLAAFALSFRSTPDNRSGFTSIDQFGRASLGSPLAVYQVQVDKLSQYNADSDPSLLLADNQMALFPILVDSSAKSSIRVQKVNGVWKTVSFGRPALTQAVAEQTTILLQNSTAPSFIVEIPTMNLAFLASNENGILMLTSLFPSKDLSLDKGTKKKASDLFLAAANVFRSKNS